MPYIGSLCCFLLFIQFSMLQPLSWKVTCSRTQKPKAHWVLDLQGWDWVHLEEEWSKYWELSENNLFIFFFFKFMKFNFFWKNLTRCSKFFYTFILKGKWSFLIISYTPSRTKSNGTIHFVLSLKLAEP